DATRSGAVEKTILRATDEGPAYDASAIHDRSADRLIVEIPPDIEAVQNRSVPLAAEWRAASRQAFLSALEAGWRVESFRRAAGGAPGGYILGRTSRGS